MDKTIKIKSALISVYHKKGLEKVLYSLVKQDVKLYSTGGTLEYINNLGFEATAVEDITSYPSILGGRVKTLHPKIFGGILCRRNNEKDKEHIVAYKIPEIDLVLVDLYPFEETISCGGSETEIIEKIDIGGISLIRAAAKNYQDVLTISSKEQYDYFSELLEKTAGNISINIRKQFAAEAFNISSHYDTAIFNYFNSTCNKPVFKHSETYSKKLRYGENPHQKGMFYGKLDEIFTQIHGKAISYNNLLDIDAAVGLISEFTETTFAILKHNNPCGIASRKNLTEAWQAALEGDPISAFGGVLISNIKIDKNTASEINKIFFEVIIAPDYCKNALKILKQKKNRIILKQQKTVNNKQQFRTILNGVLLQEKDLKPILPENLKIVTNNKPNEIEISELIFANKIVKYSKSNAIVLTKNKQLCGSGIGQTSRIDALKQAIEKAKNFNFDLKGAVLASDAFFPFADSVATANKTGIDAIIQPGGSIRDKDSIEFCNKKDMKMVFTGTRHFKH